jgi:hypothetical protein
MRSPDLERRKTTISGPVARKSTMAYAVCAIRLAGFRRWGSQSSDFQSTNVGLYEWLLSENLKVSYVSFSAFCGLCLVES